MKKSAHLLITLLLSFVLIWVFSLEPAPSKEQLLNSGVNVFMPGRLGTANFINNARKPYLITCKHVVGTSIDVQLAKESHDNKVDFSAGKVVVISETQDFAIIELTEKLFYNTHFVTYSNSSLKFGENVFYFGLINRPGKLFFVNGYVAQFNLPASPTESIDSLYSTTIPGSSGSTIFNKDGFGVGIISRTNGEHSHSFFTPERIIRERLATKGLEKLLDGNYNRSILTNEKFIKVP